ncbi:MAG: cysteine desulfurase [Planctomycetes bacterium]|nr:cysteine desulfurase [Planctomycetota bacterium]
MIYLDYNATTPTDPRVVEAMLPYLREHHGNPSSVHAMGRRVHTAVEAARLQVADLLGATPNEIVFTSSGTEANNQVIKGVADMHRGKPCHMIISAIEHPAVEKPCRYLETNGVRITAVEVDRAGMVDPDDVGRAISADTVLVSIMHANNEVGTIQPIREISQIAHQAGVLMHTDAAQSMAKIPVRVDELGVDLLTIAGHKFYAPLGVGALYIRDGVALPPLLHGAGHERGRRAGTEAVPAVVGLGEAARIAGEEMDENRLRARRDRLHQTLAAALADRMVLNGHPDRRLPNTLNVSFRRCVSADLLAGLDELCTSTGPACGSGEGIPSATLTAMGIDRDMALGAVRLSVGRFTTEAEVDRAAELLIGAMTS